MTKVRAKFKVTLLSQREHWDKQKGPIHDIQLQPVTSGSSDNERFYAATPAGQISLSTVNDDAARQFRLGAEVYVDFSPVDVDAVAGD
ncbi:MULTISPECIES: hypothetical protein [Burkholderia cepacia complex]|uniref:hypothetical protein n=1 Tax=Burkholderia cepacia complex TaxID=87882 RepID=UPI000CFEEBAD|nr:MULTISPECIES: hypothetical protein [Burkholderia cepacia complex]MBR8084624.1 hypothetical protein [Burkholderia vietnamiensis]MBU9502843.1 hypothetical protein [Burkholderia multivorans]PRG96556.1 hypothetical protein C6V04_04975 [Burkholderia multivorans]